MFDSPVTVIGMGIYFVAMVVFGLAFLFDFIRHRRKFRRFVALGLLGGLIMLGFNYLIFVMQGSHSGILNLISATTSTIKIIICVLLGMYYCEQIGLPSFRWLPTRKPPLPPEHAGDAPEEEPLQPDFLQGDEPQAWDLLPPPPLPQQTLPATEPAAGNPPASFSLIVTLGVVALTTAYSAALLLLTSPSISPTALDVLGFKEGDDLVWINGLTLVVVLAFAFGEEIVFRLGIQNFLASHFKWVAGRYWFAIIISSIVWTVGHTGSLDPDWVKYAQIFPIGLMLGWLFKKHGIESCILAHGLFNVILMFLGPHLIRV